MGWTKSRPIRQGTLTTLEKHGVNYCKHCGSKFKINDIGWFNRHMSKSGCYKKWYCVECYDEHMFM